MSWHYPRFHRILFTDYYLYSGLYYKTVKTIGTKGSGDRFVRIKWRIFKREG